jgi:predicted GNAT family acetyltransferase
MWMVNQLHVRGPQPDLTAGDLVAELDRGLADTGHRRAQVGDDATGRRLADDIAKLEGWTAAPVLVMVLEREPAEPPAGITREIDHDAMIALEALLVDEYDDIPQDDKAVVVAGRAHVTAAVPGTRYFTATADGTDVSTVYLYTDGRTGQLEDVGTLEAHRGRGLAAATVNAAAREAIAAGCDMTFLVCHAGTGPVPVYADLGFRPVGRYWAFTRRA